jgi:hypothetical protein
MNHQLERLAEQIPLVPGRVLLELTNGLTVASALTAERQAQGVVARLVSQILGRDRKADLMTLRSLIDGQQVLADWLTEVSARGAVSDLALAMAAAQLSETSRVAADARARSLALATELRSLSAVVAELAEICDKRLDEIDAWRAEVTAYLTAQRSFDLAVERWQAGRSYAALPWAYQVILLAREVATGPCGRWEQEHDGEFSTRLTDRMVTHLASRVPTTAGFMVSRQLEEGSPGLLDDTQRQLVAEVLDVGLAGDLALSPRPLATAAALTMDLSALPPADRPANPGGIAVELARRRVGWLDGGATLSSFVSTAVHEQMEAAGLAWQQLEIRHVRR